jgi:opacity protein-like surface antigen
MLGLCVWRATLATAILATYVTSASAQLSPVPAAAPVPAPDGEATSWTAAGFIGSYFAAGGNAPAANDLNGSLAFGGQVGKRWGHVGAEFLADFAPNYKIDSLALSEHPDVNSYMGNVMGIWSTRPENYVQPYVSGGIGAIQMRTSVLPASALSASTSNVNVSQSRFGWNLGGGVFAFSRHNVGVRGDVRYYRATTANTLSGTPAENLTEALLSGIKFWRGNIGVALHW